jgi:hypothetical protein
LLISIAIDRDVFGSNPFGSSYTPQTITQCKATVRTADEKPRIVTGASTVDLKLTPLRELDGAEYAPSGWGQLTAIAVLSPSTLLLSHYDRTLQVLTHTAPTAGVADCKLAGPVGVLRPLIEAGNKYGTGIAIDTDARRIFAGERNGGRIVVVDADSGRCIAVVPDQAADVVLIDGVLVACCEAENCLRFRAINDIPGLK